LSSEETTWTGQSAKCTFCSAPEKPVLTVADLKKQPQENVSLPIQRGHACNMSFFLAKGRATTPWSSIEEGERDTGRGAGG